jgi:hypothetical protein
MKLKTTKTFTKEIRIKIKKFQRIMTKLKNIIFGKLRLKDKIENK